MSIKNNEENIIISVADNGPCISDVRKEKIFDLDEKRKKSTDTGMGLFLVDTLIKNYSGDIWIEDNKPTGSIFKIKLKKT